MPATRVMVVGDDAAIIDSVSRALQSIGYRLTGVVATSGQALAHARCEHPDIALMDIALGDALGHVEAIERGCDIPVVFLAGHGERTSLARATRTASHSCVLMPFRDCDLAASLKVALDKRRSERQSQTLQARLARTLASIDDAVVAAASHGAIIYMNPAARDFFGGAAAEGTSLELVMASMWPHLARSVMQTLHEVGRTARRADGHCTVHARTGDAVDVHYTVTPMRDDEHADGAVVVLHDVTEITRAKHRLVAELRDRVNNNLQSIQGMLEIQADHISDERWAKTFRQWQHRVLAMSLVYQHIDRYDDVQRVDFAGYVRQLAHRLHAHYGAADDGIDVRIAVDELCIGVDTAIPLGLLLTELVTNSIEHAFPDGGPGVVEIGLREATQGLAELWVRDDGIGLPPDLDPCTSATFGFELVRGIGESSLGGRVCFRPAPRGTTVRLRFPLTRRAIAVESRPQ